ncbi:MAG: hypothetical protein K9L17_12475 [Clostridiales bacterium]|nr:hypothetical protein [Clostridiales bacterium]MCF8023497.1 hypothetical protein [Clostridiales bacterium]
MAKTQEELASNGKQINRIEIVGLSLVALAFFGLLFFADTMSGTFNAMMNKAYTIFEVFIFGGKVGIAIVVSVIIGRVLERLGFTDALMRIFVPIMRYCGINSAVTVPSVYNILGDINAAGRIAGPILVKANTTKDEQKIAVATMVQSQQSFSTFMLGMLAMSTVGIKVFPVIILILFVPILVVPILLKFTIWRDTKPVGLAEQPKFTPETAPLSTFFGAAKEGCELLFLLIIPAAAAIYAIIGGLEYVGIWQYVESFLNSTLGAMSIHPETGMLSILVSPTLAMGTLVETVKSSQVAPQLVLGSFVLASSGFPLSVIFGQVPAVWAESTDLTEKEAIKSALLGATMRLITAGIVATLLAPLFI